MTNLKDNYGMSSRILSPWERRVSAQKEAPETPEKSSRATQLEIGPTRLIEALAIGKSFCLVEEVNQMLTLEDMRLTATAMKANHMGRISAVIAKASRTLDRTFRSEVSIHTTARNHVFLLVIVTRVL